MENRCVCCGEIIPEGRLSCYICEISVQKLEDEGNMNFGIENITIKKMLDRYRNWINAKRRI